MKRMGDEFVLSNYEITAVLKSVTKTHLLGLAPQEFFTLYSTIIGVANELIMTGEKSQ